MFRKIIILLFILLNPVLVLANTNPSVQARVLPKNIGDLLEITDFSLEYISDNHVQLHWNSNLPAASVVKYDNTVYKTHVIRNEEYKTEHIIDLLNLKAGTLYYYSVGVYNNDDSISLGDDMFKTTGLRETFIPKIEKLVKENSEYTIGANSNYNYHYIDDTDYSVKSELFLLEDISTLFIIFSFLLVLVLIYKTQNKKNKDKKEKWEKLDK